MKRSTTAAAIIGFSLLGSVAIAGCGTGASTLSAASQAPQASHTKKGTGPTSAHGSGSPAAAGAPDTASAISPDSASASSNASAPAHPFPQIIQMAMGHVPNGLVPHPMASTQLPPEPSGSTSLYFDPYILKSPGSYTIRLATAYQTPQQAAEAAAVYQYAQGPTGTVSGQEQLSAQISGTVLQYTAASSTSAMASQPWTAIRWHEGRWTAEVTDYAQSTPPTQVAQAVVAALNT